jgi:hypothetical protein
MCCTTVKPYIIWRVKSVLFLERDFADYKLLEWIYIHCQAVSSNAPKKYFDIQLTFGGFSNLVDLFQKDEHVIKFHSETPSGDEVLTTFYRGPDKLIHTIETNKPI